MASRRFRRIRAAVGQVARAGLLAGACLTPLSSCLFPDYQAVASSAGSSATSGSSGATSGGSGALASGGSGAGGSSGSATAGSAQAGAETQGGAPSDGGNAGAPTSEPLGGAGGATPDDGTLLFDDFEDQNDDGWFPTSGDWEVGSDGSSQVYRIKNLLDTSLFAVIGDLDWTDVVVEVKVMVLEWGDTTSSDLVGVYARSTARLVTTTWPYAPTASWPSARRSTPT